MRSPLRVAEEVVEGLGERPVLLRALSALLMRTILVPFDQLGTTRGALRDARARRDNILLVESEQMLHSRPWHAQRLHLVLSAAAHFAEEMRGRGFTVHEVSAPTVAEGVRRFRATHRDVTVVATQPRSRPLGDSLAGDGLELVPDDSFLTPRDEFGRWREDGPPVMESFYRWQRRRLDLLMVDGRPEGGRWNFDADNRLAPPKGQHSWPTPLQFPMDDIDRRTWDRIRERGLPVVGTGPTGHWATTRQGALQQLNAFLTNGLAGFGPYEDAVPADTWTVNHSLLSPYLNLGLIDPEEVIAAAIRTFDKHRDQVDREIPLASIEAFVRQVAGWREYVNGVYWAMPSDYAATNELQADLPLPPAFDDPSRTQMRCLSATVSDVLARGWTHHIPRLMILANLVLIAGVRPQDLLAWMRRMFVDAADWVMVPNVIGMGAHADGGRMMTKPYAAGGAYLNRMTRHCRDCPFQPTKRTGSNACPFTTLYWDFLDRHRRRFSGNARMAQQLAGLDRLSDLDDVRDRAREVRLRLTAGDL